MTHYRYPGRNLAMLKKIAAHFQANPSGTIQLDWGGPSFTQPQWQAEFRKELHKRINRKVPQPRGRKYDDTYTSLLHRDRHRIHQALHHRAFHSGCNILSTPELQRRYPQINTPMYED